MIASFILLSANSVNRDLPGKVTNDAAARLEFLMKSFRFMVEFYRDKGNRIIHVVLEVNTVLALAIHSLSNPRLKTGLDNELMAKADRPSVSVNPQAKARG